MPRQFWLKTQKGVTLVELLVAISLFATISLLALNVFVNVTRMQGRIALESAIHEDARFMMERMARAIRSNTIDYEEYFNKGIDPDNQFGDLYGCYAAQFYNPGEGVVGGPVPLVQKPGVLGALCNTGDLYTGQECVVYKPSVDLNTGKFPFTGWTATAGYDDLKSNAFCPSGAVSCDTDGNNFFSVGQLYLIDKDGHSKTIFAQKQIKDLGGGPGPFENALAMIKLNGKDTNNDGIFEKWRNCGADAPQNFCCAPGFICDNQTFTDLETTLKMQADPYLGFVPISPLRTDVSNITFTVSPVEDPRKAFAEGINIVAQPKVTISLTVKPTKDQLSKYNTPDDSNVPVLTLQTTVSTRIQSEVKSYLGHDTVNIAKGLFPASASESTGCPLAND